MECSLDSDEGIGNDDVSSSTLRVWGQGNKAFSVGTCGFCVLVWVAKWAYLQRSGHGIAVE
eukprot:124420-Rhodomonas_salina.4